MVLHIVDQPREAVKVGSLGDQILAVEQPLVHHVHRISPFVDRGVAEMGVPNAIERQLLAENFAVLSLVYGRITGGVAHHDDRTERLDATNGIVQRRTEARSLKSDVRQLAAECGANGLLQ